MGFFYLKDETGQAHRLHTSCLTTMHPVDQPRPVAHLTEADWLAMGWHEDKETPEATDSGFDLP